MCANLNTILLENLFCDINELESMRMKISTLGSAENVYYTIAEKKVQELKA